jgi:hypothetical protein
VDDASERPRFPVRVIEAEPGTERFQAVLDLAARVLVQDRHLVSEFPAAQSHVLGA